MKTGLAWMVMGGLVAAGGADAQTFSKTETIEYHDVTTSWVLGQVKRATTNGIETTRTDYWPATALPQRTYAFGKPQQYFVYNTNGTLASVTDGNNHTTTLSNWKRGIPQTIQFPATPDQPSGATKSAVVNNQGWIDSVTDENSYVTSYGYDAMGRQTGVAYPAGDSVAWAPTTRTFLPAQAAKYGLPPGHWQHTVSTGNARTITYYDALWRPVVVETFDGTSPSTIAATASITVTRYDADGRAIFQSYPMRTLSAYTAPTQGIHSEYDALDRPTAVRQNSELGLLSTTTEYLAGFQTRVKSPRGQTTGAVTTSSYLAYDQPRTDWPVAITQPADTHTDIVRNPFGAPLSVTRRNGSRSISSTRHYVYGIHHQLCKTIEPETGSTVMAYDAANNMIWSASGQALPSTTSCDHASVPATAQVYRTYDARNRLKTLRFPDTRGDQDWEYTPDGLPWKVTTVNVPGAAHPTNLYAYNKRRMLTTETLALPASYTWSIGYTYNANGSLASQTYPSGQTVNYAPNALGQATQVVGSGTQVLDSARTYAGNVSYHPNGGIANFTYGNGIVHAMTQNTRQLPDRSSDLGGPNTPLDFRYTYDANANVTIIADDALGGNHSRWMYYDGLDRLTDAGSNSFGGDNWHRFTYDVLDNLKSWKLAGVKDYANYYYEPLTQRLTNIQASSGATVVGIGYDAQGNVNNKNGVGYAFDYGNRLRETTQAGVVLERYRYDAAGRRILANRMSGPAGSTGVVLSQYAQSGQLLYQSSDRTATTTDHIYLGGSLIAQRHVPYGGGSATIKYQHTDALGSPVAVTNQSGAVIERFEYEPYGKRIGGTPADGPGYTGHVLDTATGLNYMQARYYDSGIGRFLSVDPVTANPNTGGNFNRYAYAFNSPYKFIDPDGRYACSGGAEFCKKVDGYVAGIKTARDGLKTGSSEHRRLQKVISYIGEKGGKGPTYVAGDLRGKTAAKTDQKGMTTIDVKKMDGKRPTESGAEAVAHEGQHDLDATKNGVANTEPTVRKAEESAYKTSRAVAGGFGINWSNKDFNEAVDASVAGWVSNQQPKKSEEDAP